MILFNPCWTLWNTNTNHSNERVVVMPAYFDLLTSLAIVTSYSDHITTYWPYKTSIVPLSPSSCMVIIGHKRGWSSVYFNHLAYTRGTLVAMAKNINVFLLKVTAQTQFTLFGLFSIVLNLPTQHLISNLGLMKKKNVLVILGFSS